MDENNEYTPLPADLPENWTPGQTIAPAGADVGLSEQHGYNYLNKQVNAAQRAANQLHEDKQEKLTGTEGQVVGFNEQGVATPMEPPSGLPAGGITGQVLGKTGAEDYQAGWQDPVGRSMAGQTVEPTQGTTQVAKDGAESFNDYRKRTFEESGKPATGNVAAGSYSHAEGQGTTASGDYAHAEGSLTMASFFATHAEGTNTKSTSYSAHAEGQGTTASGGYAHAEGQGTTASGTASHAEGSGTTASGIASHAEGTDTTASNYNAHAGGQGTIASAANQTAIGLYNVSSELASDRFIIGKGANPSARANCFRATNGGVYASGNYNASGADYAELFEWADGNPDQADRCGRFVTLDGEKIRIATPDDDYILGIVSGNPSVVGDVHDDQWAGMYLYDVFGRPLWEDVEVPDEIREMPDPENPEHMIPTVIIPAHTERRQKLNPAYDNAQPYLPRSQRPEWDAVGMLGKLVAVDDGTCQVNGWCTVGEGGVATRSETRTKYRVMARLDETHIRVLIL